MAGALTISTLKNDTGVLAVQNGMTGIAKAWVNFNGTGTVAIRGSFNVSSITDNGTGDYTVNFTTAMPNANYSWSINGRNTGGSAQWYGTSTSVAPTTTTLRVLTAIGTSFVLSDNDYVCVAIFSS